METLNPFVAQGTFLELPSPGEHVKEDIKSIVGRYSWQDGGIKDELVMLAGGFMHLRDEKGLRHGKWQQLT
jgi:hypothetical protein